MTHRNFIMHEVKKFMGENNYSVLELGAGNTTDFRDNLPNCDWFTTDKQDGTWMEDLSKYYDNSYDVVFSCHAFEHCEDPIKALREMKRVARYKFMILTPYHCKHHVLDSDEDHIFVLTDMQMERLFRYVGITDYDIYVYDPENKKDQSAQLVSIGKV